MDLLPRSTRHDLSRPPPAGQSAPAEGLPSETLFDTERRPEVVTGTGGLCAIADAATIVRSRYHWAAVARALVPPVFLARRIAR
jgi:hypothetical protein